jgi:predicted DNA-binding transcriptional regulator AlpA
VKYAFKGNKGYRAWQVTDYEKRGSQNFFGKISHKSAGKVKKVGNHVSIAIQSRGSKPADARHPEMLPGQGKRTMGSIYTETYKVGVAALLGQKASSLPESESVFLDFRGLAARLGTSEQWVRRNVRRTYTRDPIPHLRFGRWIRFAWDSPEMQEWIARRKATQSATKSNVAELRPASYNGKRTEHDDTERRRK